MNIVTLVVKHFGAWSYSGVLLVISNTTKLGHQDADLTTMTTKRP